MSVGEPKPVTFKVDGVSIKAFFNESFIKMIEENFENVKFEHICIDVMEKSNEDEKERVKDKFIIGHASPQDETKEIITMGTRDPKHTKKLFGVIKKFIEGDSK